MVPGIVRCSLQCHIVQSRILCAPPGSSRAPTGPFVWLYAKWGKIVGNYISSYVPRLKDCEGARLGAGQVVLKSRLSLLAFILKRKWSHIAYTPWHNVPTTYNAAYTQCHSMCCLCVCGCVCAYGTLSPCPRLRQTICFFSHWQHSLALGQI